MRKCITISRNVTSARNAEKNLSEFETDEEPLDSILSIIYMIQICQAFSNSCLFRLLEASLHFSIRFPGDLRLHLVTYHQDMTMANQERQSVVCDQVPTK